MRNCTPRPTYYYGHMRTAVLFVLIPLTSWAQVSLPIPVTAVDSAYEPLTKAFDAVRLRDYDAAIRFFRDAAVLSPERADIRKNPRIHVVENRRHRTVPAANYGGSHAHTDPARTFTVAAR